MPRPRTANTTRSHHKKPAPPDPALDAMVDTISDGINPDETPKVSRPRPQPQKPGPKKVINETQKLIGDGLAIGIRLAGSNPDPRKSLTMPEAQSIGHPIVRMVARRLPDWLKPFLPKTKMNPDDAADVEEILATLAKVGLRLVSIMVNDFIEGREQAIAKKQYQRAMEQQPVQPAQPAVSEAFRAQAGEVVESTAPVDFKPAPAVAPSPNGHNPAFDVLAAADYGFEVV